VGSMTATLAEAAVSVREFLAQLCDDAAGYREPDRASACADCSRTMTGWCDRHLADDEAARKYAAIEKAVSAAADDGEALAVFVAALGGEEEQP
jgi:hypothetical protein